MTQSLWTQALRAAERPKGPQCTVTTFIVTLARTHPELAAEFTASIEGTEKLATIHRATVWLVEQNLATQPLGPNTIGRHRHNECLCR